MMNDTLDNRVNYRLCRLRARYDRQVLRVRSGSYKRLKTDPVPREAFFSRVILPGGKRYADYGEPEYRVVERLSIFYENEYLVTEDPEGVSGQKGVYAAEDKDPLLLCRHRGYLKDELLGREFEARDFPYSVSAALTEEGQVRLDDERFEDGDELDLLYREEGGEVRTAVRRDYVNLKHRLYLPLAVGDGLLEAERVDHSNVVYRSTRITRNSYVAVPKGTLLVVTGLKDEKAVLVNGDEVLAEAPSLQELIAKPDVVARVTRVNEGVRVGDLGACPIWVKG